MIKKLVFLSATLGGAIGLGCVAHGANPTANLSVNVVPPSSGGGGGNIPTSGNIPAGYNLDPALSDEFNGSSLDLTKWRTGLAGAASHDPCNVYVQPTVSGGYLQMPISYNGNGTFNVSFDVQANNNAPVNYYREIRMQPAAAGALLDPALFSFGLSSTGNMIEVDEEEFQSMNRTVYQGNFGRPAVYNQDNFANAFGGANNFWDGNFHVFGYWRHNGLQDFYYDGSHIIQLTDPVPPNFTDSGDQIVMQSKMESGCPANSGLPSATLVDYVRIYHP